MAGRDLLWYLNLNPRPSDVTDEKGTGTADNPAWDGNTALEWAARGACPPLWVRRPSDRWNDPLKLEGAHDHLKGLTKECAGAGKGEDCGKEHLQSCICRVMHFCQTMRACGCTPCIIRATPFWPFLLQYWLVWTVF